MFSSLEEIAITELTLADVRRWLTRLCELDRDTMGEPWGEAHWTREMPEKWRFSRVAVARGEVYGVLVASRTPATVHIHRIVVDRAARGRGVGTALLGAVAEAAARAGCLRLSLKVDPRNADAVALYQVLGFTTVATTAEHFTMEAAADATAAAAAARAARP